MTEEAVEQEVVEQEVVEQEVVEPKQRVAEAQAVLSEAQAELDEVQAEAFREEQAAKPKPSEGRMYRGQFVANRDELKQVRKDNIKEAQENG